MICAERAYRHRQIQRWLPIGRRPRLTDGKSGTSLKGEQADEAEEQDRE
jgi:hypothetical protein